MGSQFAEKPVVDFAAAQKFHHIITQMQRLKFCVWVIFIFRQPHQIVGGHAVKVRQRCNRKRADVLVVIGFVFSQRGFRQAGLLRQLFQRQVLVHHPQVFEPLRDCQLCVHPKPPLSLSFSVITPIIARFHKRGNMRISSVFPTFWIYGKGPLFSVNWFLQTGTEP